MIAHLPGFLVDWQLRSFPGRPQAHHQQVSPESVRPIMDAMMLRQRHGK
jgi:hypothetical protein